MSKRLIGFAELAVAASDGVSPPTLLRLPVYAATESELPVGSVPTGDAILKPESFTQLPSATDTPAG